MISFPVVHGLRLLALMQLSSRGRYDLVAVGDFPSEEIAMAVSLSSGKAGKLRSETMRAYGMEEMERILKRVT